MGKILDWANTEPDSNNAPLSLILCGGAFVLGLSFSPSPVREAATTAIEAVANGQNPISAIANVSASLESKWRAKKSAEFLNKTVAIAKDLGANPNHLMAIMQFESGLKANEVNRFSGATGLIQFMPSTARGLGTSTSALLAMSEIQQLDYARKYLMPYKGRLNTIGDFYASVLWPAAVGQPDGYVLFRVGHNSVSTKQRI